MPSGPIGCFLIIKLNGHCLYFLPLLVVGSLEIYSSHPGLGAL